MTDNFGKVAGGGLVATMLTGGIATVTVQPLVLSSIPAGGYAVVISWALALSIGFVVAGLVWALVVAALLVTMFSETSDTMKRVR